MKTYAEMYELQQEHEVENVYNKFCDYEHIRLGGEYNMIRERRAVLEELEFMDSPLQDGQSYVYIQRNYERIVEEMGDNLKFYEDEEGSNYWIVDIKYKQKEQ
tara:strand:+ start:212 stop:520 length:309 start_codon:yes stop_codon:yes gene_type:complete